VSEADLGDVWVSYRASRDSRLRDRLLVAYAPVVERVAVDIASGLPVQLDERDLVSCGLIGLIGAIDAYGPLNRVAFERFADPRIRAAIWNELWRLDWAPRLLVERGQALGAVEAALRSVLQRDPSDAEVAAELAIPVEELEHVRAELARRRGGSLDALLRALGRLDELAPPARWSARDVVQAIEEFDRELGRFPDDAELAAGLGADPEELEERLDGIRRAFAWLPPERPRLPAGRPPASWLPRAGTAFARLPEKQQLVLLLLYMEHLPLVETAEVVGIGVPEASRLHIAGLLRLKARLDPNE
jgi:DNA-directed RNA polymerase specialized sigma subunit